MNLDSEVILLLLKVLNLQPLKVDIIDNVIVSNRDVTLTPRRHKDKRGKTGKNPLPIFVANTTRLGEEMRQKHGVKKGFKILATFLSSKIQTPKSQS